MASEDHRFLSSSLYSTGVLVAWDPAPFSANLSKVRDTNIGHSIILLQLTRSRDIYTHTEWPGIEYGKRKTLDLSLPQWYNKTDYPIFDQYQRYRRLHPLQPFYILHPRFEWQLWQRIQDNMAEPIQKNPPSSGLLGKGIMPPRLLLTLLILVHPDLLDFLIVPDSIHGPDPWDYSI